MIIDDDEEYCRLVEKTFGSKFVFTRIRNMSELKAIIERKECFDVIILNYDLDEAEIQRLIDEGYQIQYE